MLFIEYMKDAPANDNDEQLSFITLGALTRNVVEYLLENSQNHERDGERQTPRKRTDEEKAEDERRYIKQRLRDIRRFEESYSIGRKDRR